MKIEISPVTRVSGLLSIDLFVDSNGEVTEANVIGEQFRGFEAMMRGRKVSDAVYLTQRICGICSMAHGFTAAKLVEKIYGIQLTPEIIMLQQAMLGAEFLQNHIRHFYLLALPDYLDSTETGPINTNPTPDKSRFTLAQQKLYIDHYFTAIEISRKCHDMLAIFGGKIPHQHGLIAGGVTVEPTADRRVQFQSLLAEVRQFLLDIMLPDIQLLSKTYRDYWKIGTGPGRFISWGLFDPRFGGHFPAGIFVDGKLYPIDFKEIAESITFAWYQKETNPETKDAIIRPTPVKPGAYSWVKAARYNGRAFEGGPLARKIITLQTNASGLLATIGVMARLLARAEEAVLISGWMKEWIAQLPQQGKYIIPNEEPVLTKAFQANDAPRGPLLHAVSVSDAKVASYDIITPSTWNFSPKDETGERGPAETALVGSNSNIDNGTQPGRIIRSFDPCLSCATHLIELRGQNKMKLNLINESEV